MNSDKNSGVACYSGESKQIEILIERPGQGSPGKDCQKYMKFVCLDGNKEFVRRHNCMLRTCPNCYDKWAHKQAKMGTVNLLFNRRGRGLVHAMISIPGDPEDCYRYLNYAYQIAFLHYIDGGIVVPHFERHGKIDGYCHYHIIGYVRGKYGPGIPGKLWVFKVIRWIHKNWDVRGVFKYILTHCGIMKNKHAVNYFGQKFKKPIREKAYNNGGACPFCGSKNTIPGEKLDYSEPIRPEVVYCKVKPG